MMAVRMMCPMCDGCMHLRVCGKKMFMADDERECASYVETPALPMPYFNDELLVMAIEMHHALRTGSTLPEETLGRFGRRILEIEGAIRG